MTNMFRHLCGGRALRRLAIVLLVTLALAVVEAGTAWGAGPLLAVDSAANTTVAPDSDLNYFLLVKNVGDAPTDGSEIDLTITLPAHVSAVGVFFGFAFSCSAADGSPVAGASVVKCATASVIGPLDRLTLNLVVHVDGAVSDGDALTSTLDVTGGGASAAGTVDPTRVSSTLPGFGIDAFDGQVSADPVGDPFTQAGGHPYAISTAFDFNTVTNQLLTGPPPFYNQFSGDLWPVEATKDAIVDLPPGLIGDPSVVTQCTPAELTGGINGIDFLPLCAPSSQIGTALLRVNSAGRAGQSGVLPVFSIVPPPGVPARFGFNVAGIAVMLDARVRSNGDYGFSIDARNIPDGVAIAGNNITFWGVPADHSHDAQRWCSGTPSPCGAGVPAKAFLRNPTACTPEGEGLTTALHIDSWFHPARFNPDGSPDLSDANWQSASFESHLPPGYPFFPGPEQSNWGAIRGPTDCDRVPFDPTFDARPVGQARAGTPTGFHFNLHIPQTDDPSVTAQGDLRKAVVTLPAGVHVSPSSADGLGACTAAQIGLLGTGFPEPNRIRFSTAEPQCPENSKIGTVQIDTPLLPDPLTGAVYLASPNDNPFGTLLSIYLVAEGSGVLIKLPGKIEASSTGQVTATFDDSPQTPFTDLQLSFFGGPRAALVLPSTCGTYTTHAELTSWSGKTVGSDSSFTVDHESDGSACAGLTFNPSFKAGTTNAVGGAETSFLLSLGRSDRDRTLGSVAVDMPGGLVGKIANAVLCPDGPANAGTCTDGSKIGDVTVRAGAGTNPFEITTGRAYVTGPYKGAPFGLSIVVPAVAGPFDLGNVVVRSALFVDKHTAALKVVSDAFPTVLEGIPLDLRVVRVLVDRPHFIVNPTDCSQKQIFGTITSADGFVAHRAYPFKRTSCARLAFKPRMSLTVGGRHRTRAGASTPLTATIRMGAGQANLRRVTVSLPTTLNALLPVLNRACTQAQFDAGQCAGARAGSAVAVTPVLRDPLRGSAFFVKHPKQVLPDLVVTLRGQVAFDLIGKVSVDRKTNRLTTRFDAPDVAVSKFALRLVAGANGPLGTTTNLCSAKAKRATASITFRAQNNKALHVNQRLRILGCPRRH